MYSATGALLRITYTLYGGTPPLTVYLITKSVPVKVGIGYEAGTPLVVVVLVIGLILIGITAFLYIIIRRHRETIRTLLTE